ADGPAANDDLDRGEQARLAALRARVRARDPETLAAPELRALATRGGAAALGLDSVGAIEPGRWADLVLLRTDDPGLVPIVEERDLLSHLVWSGGGRLVRDVWVAGRQLVRAGEHLTIDVDRACPGRCGAPAPVGYFNSVGMLGTWPAAIAFSFSISFATMSCGTFGEIFPRPAAPDATSKTTSLPPANVPSCTLLIVLKTAMSS